MHLNEHVFQHSLNLEPRNQDPGLGSQKLRPYFLFPLF